MLDMLHINQLSTSCTIGVHPWEQRIKQKLFLDISIFADLSACNDDLKHTIDYDQLCQSITDLVEHRSFQLIETVAHECARYICAHHDVQRLIIKVTKPQAIKQAAGVSIQVEYPRDV